MRATNLTASLCFVLVSTLQFSGQTLTPERRANIERLLELIGATSLVQQGAEEMGAETADVLGRARRSVARPFAGYSTLRYLVGRSTA